MAEDAKSGPRRVAVIGGTFSGNKGAAAMVQAVIDRLPERVGACVFAVLSAYPEQDRALLPGSSVRVVAATPMDLVKSFVLACLARALRLLRIPDGWLLRTGMLRVLRQAHVAVDVGGISFVDGRGLVVLAYNVILPGIPLLLGVPTVKASQALGPFEGRLNRLLARLVLQRVTHTYARGQRTLEHLWTLGVEHASLASDLAFVLDPPPAAAVEARRWLSGHAATVTLVPSRVVEEHCVRAGINYPRLLGTFARALADRGFRVLVVPHAARRGAPASRMNDLPVSRAVYQEAGGGERVLLIDEELSAHVLRAIIAGSEVVVTARFHAMISALATCTPVVVTGWSHKYREVLSVFDLDDAVLGYGDLSLDRLLERFESVYRRREDYRESIREALPKVTEDALRNFDAVADVLGR